MQAGFYFCTSLVEFADLLKTSALDLGIIGAAKVLGSIEVDDLVDNIYGAAIMDISGSSKSFEIDAEGTSAVTGFDF